MIIVNTEDTSALHEIVCVAWGGVVWSATRMCAHVFSDSLCLRIKGSHDEDFGVAKRRILEYGTRLEV